MLTQLRYFAKSEADNNIDGVDGNPEYTVHLPRLSLNAFSKSAESLMRLSSVVGPSKRASACWQYLTSRPQDSGPYLLTFNRSWRYGICRMSTGYADATE